MDKIIIIRSEEHKTTKWSGGTTTQLYIYPNNAEYSKRNFKFRLSSAQVYDEESTFTKLPNINRKLMVLDGELVIHHKDHHSIKLNRFEKDSFLGNWDTKSFGKARDFNLMMNEECDGELEYIQLYSKVKKNITIDSKENYRYSTYALFIVDGKVSIKIDDSMEMCLNSNDLIIVNDVVKKVELLNKEDNNVDIIISKIFYN